MSTELGIGGVTVARPFTEEVYCDYCHLATPAWRQRCIHCFKPLQMGDKRNVSRLEGRRKDREQNGH